MTRRSLFAAAAALFGVKATPAPVTPPPDPDAIYEMKNTAALVFSSAPSRDCHICGGTGKVFWLNVGRYKDTVISPCSCAPRPAVFDWTVK
jgi:hypothetical protein